MSPAVSPSATTSPARKRAAPRTPPARRSPPAGEEAAGDDALPHFPEPRKLAVGLRRFLDEHGLVLTEGEGPTAWRYVLLEGWAFIGAQLGQAAATQWCRDVSTATATVFHARAVLIHLASGRRVGAGEATASSSEPSLETAPAHVVAMLAQNRACINAYYLALGWLLQLAGIDATPPELLGALPIAAGAVVPAVAPQPPGPTDAVRAEVPAEVPAAVPTTLRQAQQQQAAAAARPKGAPMRAEQHEEITRRYNHPAVPRPMKTRILAAINTFDEADADKTLAKLQALIDAAS